MFNTPIFCSGFTIQDSVTFLKRNFENNFLKTKREMLKVGNSKAGLGIFSMIDTTFVVEQIWKIMIPQVK